MYVIYADNGERVRRVMMASNADKARRITGKHNEQGEAFWLASGVAPAERWDFIESDFYDEFAELVND